MATNSTDFQRAAVAVRSLQRTVLGPVDRLVSWGLHQAGLPSHADMRAMRRQIGDLQRDLSALRRELANAERSRRHQP
jgi:hypothetical protein